MSTISIFTASGSCIVRDAPIAASFFARLTGLLTRRFLRECDGLMLEPGGSVHTLGMRYAIDVVFFDCRLRVLRVISHLEPWRCGFAPRGTTRVLELPAGRASTLGLRTGMQLQATREERSWKTRDAE